jgi:hypothetical protein
LSDSGAQSGPQAVGETAKPRETDPASYPYHSDEKRRHAPEDITCQRDQVSCIMAIGADKQMNRMFQIGPALRFHQPRYVNHHPESAIPKIADDSSCPRIPHIHIAH